MAAPFISRNNYHNNGGANGASSSGAGGPTAGPPGGGPGPFYQNDGGYTAPPTAGKPLGKKPAGHLGGKPPFVGAPSFQASPTPGPGSYGQFGQGYGQPKKNFGQNQGGGGYGNYSTAYPSQMTGAGGNQDYSYEGYGNQSNYGTQGEGHQGYPGPCHTPGGYGRGEPSMNYQYR